jgi:hypothetical protein
MSTLSICTTGNTGNADGDDDGGTNDEEEDSL